MWRFELPASHASLFCFPRQHQTRRSLTTRESLIPFRELTETRSNNRMVPARRHLRLLVALAAVTLLHSSLFSRSSIKDTMLVHTPSVSRNMHTRTRLITYIILNFFFFLSNSSTSFLFSSLFYLRISPLCVISSFASSFHSHSLALRHTG